MNRAILIVICDFLVSAMLSMMTGMAPVHPGFGAGLDSKTAAMLIAELRQRERELTSAREQLQEAQRRLGYDEERERQLKALTAQLAETLARTEKLESQMKLKPQSLGRQTTEQLQAQLDKEVARRHQLRIEYDDSRRQVEDLKKGLADNVANLGRVNEDFAATRQRLADTTEQLTEAQKTIRVRDEGLAQAREDLTQTRENLVASKTELTGARSQLKAAMKRTNELAKEKQNLEGNLSYTQGQLTASERALAETRSIAERNRKLASERELERNEAKRQLEEMSKMLKNAVTELSQTKSELSKARELAANSDRELIATQGKAERVSLERDQARKLLSEAEKKLSVDVLARYSEATVRLDINVTEKRLFLNQHGGGQFFMPLINLGGKVVASSTFPIFAGNSDTALNFMDIIQADYRVNAPEASTFAVGNKLTGSIMTLTDEPRIAAMEVDPAGRIPLEVMTIGKLKKRGLEELFLFKASSYGKDSAGLGGRCSLDFSSNDHYLYIRNTGRGTGSELRSEPGDVVLTREGDFVGVVISIEKFDYGRREEAKCYVFPDEFSWENASLIPTGASGEDGLKRFSEAVLRHYEEIGKFAEK